MAVVAAVDEPIPEPASLDAYRRLGDEVADAHIPPDGPDTCDVDAAYGTDLYLYAAYLLMNATEVPRTLERQYDLAHTPERFAWEKAQFEAIPRRTCHACGCTVNLWFGGPEACHNCRADPPAPPEEPDESEEAEEAEA